MVSYIFSVITGLRFVREDGVLYIQGKQGKLLPNGWTDPSSQNWIPLKKDGNVAVVNMSNNKFYLDDLRLLPNYAVVGE